MEVDTTTIMVVCDSLEKKLYIRRTADAADRRINRLEVTEAGRIAADSALPLIIGVLQPLTGSISGEEAGTAIAVLVKIAKALAEAGDESDLRGGIR